jgi:predicted metal-dependent phosphoesterase TrpH
VYLLWNVVQALLLISHLYHLFDEHRLPFFVPSLTSTPKQAATDAVVERQAAEQLHVEIIPGTEVMTDIGGFHLAKAGGNGSV